MSVKRVPRGMCLASEGETEEEAAKEDEEEA
jgi:hypothetical protein